MMMMSPAGASSTAARRPAIPLPTIMKSPRTSTEGYTNAAIGDWRDVWPITYRPITYHQAGMLRVDVAAGPHRYPIYIEHGLTAQLGRLIEQSPVPAPRQFFI